MSAWDPQLYLQFAAERTRPAAELAARVAVDCARRVIDLGCGPGNSTAVLRARWPQADLTGLDRDDAMLAAARQAEPTTRWQAGDAAAWEAEAAYDVVFSNAMLQWLPDQSAVLHRWFRAVRPGGALAVQLPNQNRSALHQCVLDSAADPRWRDATATAARAAETHDVGFYYDALCRSARCIDAWETVYHHVMAGPESILEWVRGTGLRPLLAALPDDAQRGRFEAEVAARLAVAFPRRPDGRVLLPFGRVFLIAYADAV
jgi:trans-aconitate 2-methyltransferase